MKNKYHMYLKMLLGAIVIIGSVNSSQGPKTKAGWYEVDESDTSQPFHPSDYDKDPFDDISRKIADGVTSINLGAINRGDQGRLNTVRITGKTDSNKKITEARPLSSNYYEGPLLKQLKQTVQEVTGVKDRPLDGISINFFDSIPETKSDETVVSLLALIRKNKNPVKK